MERISQRTHLNKEHPMDNEKDRNAHVIRKDDVTEVSLQKRMMGINQGNNHRPDSDFFSKMHVFLLIKSF